MERDNCYYNELKVVRDYACKAAGLDPVIAGWKTAVDALTTKYNDLLMKYQPLVDFYDKHNGTPCEQIRHAEELADAQRALDAERERVKELEEWQRVVVGTGTDQEAVVRMAATEYTKIAVQCWKDENAKLTAQLATLQAQLADRDAMILQMGEQAAVLAKENMAVKAQLRQVEGERDAADAELHRDMVEYCQFAHEIALPGTRLPEQVDDSISFGKLKDVVNAIVASRDTLRQLVEALPVVDGRMDVECGACYYIRSFVAGQYGVVCGLITEPSTAMAIKTLLEYRATQAAQDAGKGVSSG